MTMKRKLNYVAAALLITVVIAGCTKSNVNNNIANNTFVFPQGNFLGQFRLIHPSAKGFGFDTLYANITLNMSSDYSYSVGGDTSKIQVGSYGTFTPDVNTITFVDATVTKRTSPNTLKKHLNGPFLYTFNGSNLHIYGAADTLSYDYALMKTN